MRTLRWYTLIQTVAMRSKHLCRLHLHTARERLGWAVQMGWADFSLHCQGLSGDTVLARHEEIFALRNYAKQKCPGALETPIDYT